MIKVILLFIIVIILLYAIPRINNVSLTKKKKHKKKKNKEHFVQPIEQTDQVGVTELTDKHFLEDVEKKLCDPNSQQINAEVIDGSGMYVRNASKQLECIPICTVNNSNIVLEKNCIPCGSADNANPGTITQRVTERCVEHIDDMNFSILQPNDTLSELKTCMYDRDYQNCSNCDIIDMGCMFEGPDNSCKRTVHIQPPRGQSRCIMNWSRYANDTDDDNIERYAREKDASISEFTEKLDSPHIFKVDCDQCDRDCSLSDFWVQQDCPTNCGSPQSARRYTKNIQQNFQNDGKNCLSVAMDTDYYETTENVEYSIVGDKVEKRVPNECSSTLPCCEVNTDSHYSDWTYADGTPLGWNGRDTPNNCDTTYKRTRRFDLTECINGNNLPYEQVNEVTSFPCCSRLNADHYNIQYDYKYYDLQDNPINTRSNQTKMSLNKENVPCQQKVIQVKSYPFNSNVCISSAPKLFPNHEITFENKDTCPEDCEVSPSTSLSDCPVCKENALDRRPRQERIWEVTQARKGTLEDTKTCAQAFNTSKSPFEIPLQSIYNIEGSTFPTYIECPADTKVCCSPFDNDHFSYRDTYTKHPIIYSNNSRMSPFEVDHTDSTPSFKHEFDNIDNYCNTSIVKTRTYNSKPNICTFRNGDSISSIKPPYSEQRVSSTRCAIDCKLSVSEFTECEEKCGPRKKYRTWTVTEAPQYGGETCSNLFYNVEKLRENNIELEHNENVTISGFTNLIGRQFQSEVECDTVIPCCNSDSNDHFISTVVAYGKHTPWSDNDYVTYSDDSNDPNWVGNLNQGSLLYNDDSSMGGSVPCNTRMRKKVTFEPDNSVCLGGEEAYTLFHDKVNKDICAEDCEMMLSSESDWSECKTNDGNRNNIQCNPGVTPTKERKWVVTKKNSETGLSCQEVFNTLNTSSTDKEVGETAIIPSDIIQSGEFTSYKECSSLKNCCDPREDSHWNSTITYKSVYPYDSLIEQDLSASEGEQFFEVGGPSPLNNTKIKKITTYTRNAANCSHGETKANDVDERVNTNIDCVLIPNPNWGECEGNCGLNSIRKRQWSVDVVPQGDGETCSEVLQSHSERESNEVPINGYENVPNQGNFETSKECTHGLPCCEWNSSSHWTNSEDIYYRKYNYNDTNIPTSEDKIENLDGTGTDANPDTFEDPPCNTKVVKFRKLIRNTANCKEGDEDYYERIAMKEGRNTCDCEISRTPNAEGWDTENCSAETCIEEGGNPGYMTRKWTINNNNDEESDGASCVEIFNRQIRGTETIANEVFVELNSDENYVKSRAPCPVDFCQIDCELSVSDTYTGVSDCDDCKQPGEDDGVKKYTWTVTRAPNHGGSSCADVADNMISTRAFGETRGTVSDTEHSTFETTITCRDRNICPASGTFSISLTGDDNDIGINSFKFILTDGTNYPNNFVFDNDIILVEDNELNTVNTERRLINPEDSTLSNRTNIGVSDINGTVVTVSQLVPDTEYKFVLRRKYNQVSGIPPIYTNSLTIETNPQHCEIEHSDWEDCSTACYIDTPHVQTRTWTVTKAPVGGDSCSEILSGIKGTDETINGTLGDELNDEVNTEQNCGTPCGQCEYGSWVYHSGTPTSWDGSTTPPCGTTYRRTRPVNTIDCRNIDGRVTIDDHISGPRCCGESDYTYNYSNAEWSSLEVPCDQTRTRTKTLNTSSCAQNGLPTSETVATKSGSSCLPACSATNDSHWNASDTYYLHQPIGSTGEQYSGNPSGQIPCNSKITKNTSYSIKSGTCVGGDTYRSGTTGVQVNIDHTSCVSQPSLGSPYDITQTSFKIPIQTVGTYNTRTVNTSPNEWEASISIDGNVIVASNFSNSTTYTVSLTNIGEDGISWTVNTTVRTLGSQDCSMGVDASSEVDGWSECDYLCGGDGVRTRTWQILEEQTDGGKTCNEVFRLHAVRDGMRNGETIPDEPVEVLEPGQVLPTTKGARFTTQKSCLNNCGIPSIGSVENCDDNEKDIFRTAKIAGITLNNINGITPRYVYLMYVKLNDAGLIVGTEAMHDVTEQLLHNGHNFCYTGQTQSQLLETGATYRFWIRKVYNDQQDDYVESNSLDRRICQSVLSMYSSTDYAYAEAQVIRINKDPSNSGIIHNPSPPLTVLGYNDEGYDLSELYENSLRNYETDSNIIILGTNSIERRGDAFITGLERLWPWYTGYGLRDEVEGQICGQTYMLRKRWAKTCAGVGPANMYQYYIRSSEDCSSQEEAGPESVATEEVLLAPPVTAAGPESGTEQVTVPVTAAAGTTVVINPSPVIDILTPVTTPNLPECNITRGNLAASACCVESLWGHQQYADICPEPDGGSCHIKEVEFRLFSHALGQDANAVKKTVTSPYNASGGGPILFNNREDGFIINLLYDDIMGSLDSLTVNNTEYSGDVTNDNYSGRIEIYYVLDNRRCTATNYNIFVRNISFRQSSSVSLSQSSSVSSSQSSSGKFYAGQPCNFNEQCISGECWVPPGDDTSIYNPGTRICK